MVTPACPARGVGISPCWVGLDHSIYKMKNLKILKYNSSDNLMHKIKKMVNLQFASQEHADHWNKQHVSPHQI